jgi:hypothetical protein
LKVGDIVLMCDEGYPRGKWPIARVTEVFLDSDNHVRKVTLKCKNGIKVRPITKHKTSFVRGHRLNPRIRFVIITNVNIHFVKTYIACTIYVLKANLKTVKLFCLVT